MNPVKVFSRWTAPCDTPALRLGTKTPLTRTTESAEAAEFAEEGTQANARSAGHRNVLTLNARSALPTACVYRSVGSAASALSAVRAAMPWVRCGVPDKWGFRGGQIFVVDRPLRYALARTASFWPLSKSLVFFCVAFKRMFLAFRYALACFLFFVFRFLQRFYGDRCDAFSF